MAIIIGGGISGLATAWFLHSSGVKVRLLEANSRFGGAIHTHHKDGYTIECGPNSTLRKPQHEDDALGRLVAGAGFERDFLRAGKEGDKRFVLRGGELKTVPSSPQSFLTTSLFGWQAKLRLLKEPFIKPAQHEETIAEFVERRLGQEFHDYAIEPFISGVYAGDTHKLSVRAAVPRIYRLEKEFGSLIRGAMALGKAAKGAGMPTGGMYSFNGGMQTLPDRIAAALPEGACRMNCVVEALERDGGQWKVTWRQGDATETIKTDTVVLAVPAGPAARLLAPLSAEVADILSSISYASLASVALGYKRQDVRHALDGFGFLVPRKEALRSLGGLFSSSLFAHRAPENRVLITAFIGGAMDGAAIGLSDDDLLHHITSELDRVLGITGGPELAHITRHEQAIPQYNLGHLERLAALDKATEVLPGLRLQASWRGGVSVADCVRNAEKLAQEIVTGGELAV